MIRKPMGIAPGPIYQRQKPVRDPAYLKFIRSLPSAKSGRYGCECVHTGAHGLSQKSSDLNCIPLTRQEHREYGSDPRGCEKRWGIDREKLIARLNKVYRLQQACGITRAMQAEAIEAALSQHKDRVA